MYQYLVSKDVQPLFQLYLSHPRTPLFLRSTASQPIALYKNSVILVFLNEDNDIDANKLEELELLVVSNIISSNY